MNIMMSDWYAELQSTHYVLFIISESRDFRWSDLYTKNENLYENIPFRDVEVEVPGCWKMDMSINIQMLFVYHQCTGYSILSDIVASDDVDQIITIYSEPWFPFWPMHPQNACALNLFNNANNNHRQKYYYNYFDEHNNKQQTYHKVNVVYKENGEPYCYNYAIIGKFNNKPVIGFSMREVTDVSQCDIIKSIKKQQKSKHGKYERIIGCYVGFN